MEQELPTLPEHLSSPLVFSGVHVASSLVFCVVFCRSLFDLLSIVLSFFNLQILTTHLVSLNSSFNCVFFSPLCRFSSKVVYTSFRLFLIFFSVYIFCLYKMQLCMLFEFIKYVWIKYKHNVFIFSSSKY
jgi:hypothetical protein